MKEAICNRRKSHGFWIAADLFPFSCKGWELEMYAWLCGQTSTNSLGFPFAWTEELICWSPFRASSAHRATSWICKMPGADPRPDWPDPWPFLFALKITHQTTSRDFYFYLKKYIYIINNHGLDKFLKMLKPYRIFTVRI